VFARLRPRGASVREVMLTKEPSFQSHATPAEWGERTTCVLGPLPIGLRYETATGMGSNASWPSSRPHSLREPSLPRWRGRQTAGEYTTGEGLHAFRGVFLRFDPDRRRDVRS
jgi:hypothetical protein